MEANEIRKLIEKNTIGTDMLREDRAFEAGWSACEESIKFSATEKAIDTLEKIKWKILLIYPEHWSILSNLINVQIRQLETEGA